MKIPVKYDYGCKVMLELSLEWPNKNPVQISTISEKYNIPRAYLIQILNQLKNKGLVKSIRGQNGGYLLALPPSRITVGEVLESISGKIIELPNPSIDVMISLWIKVRDEVRNLLYHITFEDLVNQVRNLYTYYI